MKDPKVVETIRNKDIPLGTKRKAMKEARLIAEKGIADFSNCPDIGSFAWWDKTPSGHDFWQNIYEAEDK